MSNKLFIFLFLLLSTSISALEPETYQQVVAEKVLGKLYDTQGDRSIRKPTIRISFENKKVAAFYPAKNEIVFDLKAYEICQSFGNDSLSAMSFLLGHELAHKYHNDSRKGNSSTNFLAYDQEINADIRTEKVADVQGAFNAWLSGYKAQNIMPQLMDRIYTVYGLKDKQIKGYPPLSERARTAQEVADLVSQLADLYDGASYLYALGDYEMAAASWSHILEYYQGREVYNNLGTTYARWAMEYYWKATDQFIYPLELDWSSALKKDKARGAIEFGSPEFMYRTQLLQKAEKYLRKAIELDKNDLTSQLNLVTVLHLQTRHAEAAQYLKKRMPKGIKKARVEGIQMLMAITDYLQNNTLSARTRFVSLTNSRDPMVQLQANYNLDIVNGKVPKRGAQSEVWRLPKAYLIQVASIEMPNMKTVEPITIDKDASLWFSVKAEGKSEKTYRFGQGSAPQVTITAHSNRLAPNLNLFDRDINLASEGFANISFAPSGYFVVSEADNAIIKIDTKGRILEMARVYQHK